MSWTGRNGKEMKRNDHVQFTAYPVFNIIYAAVLFLHQQYVYMALCYTWQTEELNILLLKHCQSLPPTWFISVMDSLANVHVMITFWFPDSLMQNPHEGALPLDYIYICRCRNKTQGWCSSCLSQACIRIFLKVFFVIFWFEKSWNVLKLSSSVM